VANHKRVRQSLEELRRGPEDVAVLRDEPRTTTLLGPSIRAAGEDRRRRFPNDEQARFQASDIAGRVGSRSACRIGDEGLKPFTVQ